jgi:hypothetical protein
VVVARGAHPAANVITPVAAAKPEPFKNKRRDNDGAASFGWFGI